MTGYLMRRVYAAEDARVYGTELAVVCKRSDRAGPAPPNEFVTWSHFPLQVGVLYRTPADVVPPHTHVIRPRPDAPSQEVVYVVEGEAVVTVYDRTGKPVESVNLLPQDFVVLLGGGHSVKFLEPTLLLEAKLGPYPGRDADKTDFTPRT